MNKYAIIGGSGLKDYQNKNIFFLQRHGENVPPHKINHKRNISLLKDKNITHVIGVCSVGSLKSSIVPGDIILPHDYINLNNIITFYDETAEHIVPEINKELREKIISTANSINLKILDKGIYIQTMGPRFETEAEINMFSNFADIVGMTMTHEASLAQEAGLKYACIAMVDNFANGVNKKLEKKDWEQAQKENLPKIIKLLNNLLI